MSNDPYFSRSEVSNSDLGWLKSQFACKSWVSDATTAYRFGTLVDAFITEPEKVDHFKLAVLDGGEWINYTQDEFKLAREMKNAALKDSIVNHWLSLSTFQKVFAKPVDLQYDGYQFKMIMRCKYDLFMDAVGWGGDIKSTTATSQKQFEEAVRYFDYDRQRVNYMNLSGSQRDVIIGISKVNCRVFKVPISRGDDLWESGIQKLSEWAFKWHMLFG